MTKVVERILNLLAFLLTAPRPVSADEIRFTVAGYGQDSDESFRRMFERDKDLLRSIGIPIEMAATDHWEVEFGYVVPPDEYQLDDPGLTDDELTALGLAAHAVRVGSVAPGPEALFKLGGAPAASGDLVAADLGADADAVTEVFGAVAERRTMTFDYRGSERTINPYGLAHRRGHWYVLGPTPGDADVRAFRLDRASGLEIGKKPGAFTRPKGFSASKALATEPWQAGTDDLVAVVRFDADVAWWARRRLSGATSVASRDDGAIDVTLPVANPDAFIGWLIGFDDHAEILEPESLRRAFVERVAA